MPFDIVGFYEAEANRVHEVLDEALITRTTLDGEVLSLSQRVEQATLLLRHYMQQYMKHL